MSPDEDLSRCCQLLLDRMFMSTGGSDLTETTFDFPAQRRGLTELMSLLEKCVSYGKNYIKYTFVILALYKM